MIGPIVELAHSVPERGSFERGVDREVRDQREYDLDRSHAAQGAIVCR